MNSSTQDHKEPTSKLLILFTGGTMGMYLDPESGTLSNVPGKFPDLVKSMPECSHPEAFI